MGKSVLNWAAAVVLCLCASSSFAQYKVDTRAVVRLSNEENAWLLNEMRDHFQAVQVIIGALAEGDNETVKKTATSRGLAHLKEPTRLQFSQKVPESWKTLAPSMHKAFDAIAESAGQNAPKEQTLAKVSSLMQLCNACHVSSRLVDEHLPLTGK